MSLLLLYNAAVTLQIKGDNHLLLLKRLLETAEYVNFIIPKHLSINDLRLLKDLYKQR